MNSHRCPKPHHSITDGAITHAHKPNTQCKQAWARGHGLNEARLGSLSSYAYSLLCIGYMQAIGAFWHTCMHVNKHAAPPPPTFSSFFTYVYLTAKHIHTHT